MVLVLGLGNPGPQYELTRHNAGFLGIDLLSRKHQIRMDQHGFHSQWGEGVVSGMPVLLAKPVTYMNNSGVAARALLQHCNETPDRLIVIHDEIDLPLGRFKQKIEGGAAGQRGILSIIDCLQTNRFHRVRVGIGRPDNKEDIVDYVLSPFTTSEQTEINIVLESVVERVEQILKELNSPS